MLNYEKRKNMFCFGRGKYVTRCQLVVVEATSKVLTKADLTRIKLISSPSVALPQPPASFGSPLGMGRGAAAWRY